eukprot:COSAG02_NODE_4652_length_5132_cov_2.838069_1_plen_23_part_10
MFDGMIFQQLIGFATGVACTLYL